MVKLSPKALRFAEDAVRAWADAHPRSIGPAEIWQSWHAERPMAARSVATGGYTEVPTAVAEVLFSAVELRIAQMERRLDPDAAADPDLGNDIAFLRDVSGALRAAVEPLREPIGR